MFLSICVPREGILQHTSRGYYRYILLVPLTAGDSLVRKSGLCGVYFLFTQYLQRLFCAEWASSMRITDSTLRHAAGLP